MSGSLAQFQNKLQLPSMATLRFSELFLLVVLALKPGMDALYELPAAKYLYMLTLICAGLLAYAGKGYFRPSVKASTNAPRGRDSALRILFWILSYAAFLYVTAVVNGGSLHEIFKIVSPFIFYLLVRGNISFNLRYAILALALLVIFANAALLPFDYGWTYWGSVRTFKGFYYFKTDLAFSIVTSLVLIGMFYGFRMHPIFVTALVVGAIEVVLSNARLNYLTFALFLVFLFWRNGVSLGRLLGSAAVVTAVGGIGLALYDQVTQLSPFDFSDVNRFTQGREQIWHILVAEGLLKGTFSDLLFGRGIWFDWFLINDYGYGFQQTHNAHNELIHLLLTQGLLGLFLYGWLWVCVTRDSLQRTTASVSLAPVLFAFGLLGLQSLTAVVSSYASKTWPIVLILLMMQAMDRRDHAQIAGNEAANSRGRDPTPALL